MIILLYYHLIYNKDLVLCEPMLYNEINMKLRVQEKQEALKLRKQGRSYKEIMKRVPVSKSTLSGWLTHLKLTTEQEAALEKRSKIIQDRGRLKAALTNRKNRIRREQEAVSAAKKEFPLYIKDHLFVAGIVLYWAEGSKKSSSFQFVNSDPEAIKVMVRWITAYLKIPKKSIGVRLYIHRVYAHENCEQFWAHMLQIPVKSLKKTVYKPTAHKVKKNPEYKGCVRLEVGKIDNYRKVMAWQKLLSAYILG